MKIPKMPGRGKVPILDVAVALILVAAPAALAANGGNFILGQQNVATAISKLVGKVAGPSLLTNNGSEDPKATALQLNVKPGKPPMKVNSDKKVAKLNADKLDGKDSTEFYAAGSKVADSAHADNATNATNAGNADTLDGLDSSAYGLKLVRSFMVFSDFCDTVNTWNECASIDITVPAGKTYQAMAVAEGTFYEAAATENRVLFCPSARKTTDAGANCGAQERGLLLNAGQMESTSDSTWFTLTEGTWRLSSAINSSDSLDIKSGFDTAKIQTVALIRDASGAAPASLSAKAVPVPEQQKER